MKIKIIINFSTALNDNSRIMASKFYSDGNKTFIFYVWNMDINCKKQTNTYWLMFIEICVMKLRFFIIIQNQVRIDSV